MHEENNFPRKENYVAVKMLCFQVVYLLANYIPYSVHQHFMQLFATIGADLNFGYFAVLLAYPIVSVFSFCVFIWAYVTEKLQKRRVRIIYNLPFIALVVMIHMLIVELMLTGVGRRNGGLLIFSLGVSFVLAVGLFNATFTEWLFLAMPESFYEEKNFAILMFCAQIFYLLVNCVVYFFILPRFIHVFSSFGFESVTALFLSFGFLDALTAILALLIYPIISILSFCVFIWAYVTGNLQNRKVLIMYNLPPILICIIFMLSFLPRPTCSHYPGFM